MSYESIMSPGIAKIVAAIRRVGPYLAVELILPGGSLIALTLWLLRNPSPLRRSLARIHLLARTILQSVAVVRPSTASTL
jgi:hypothetical protein